MISVVLELREILGTAHNPRLTLIVRIPAVERTMASSVQVLLLIRWPLSFKDADLKSINKLTQVVGITWSIFQWRDSKRNRLRTWLSTPHVPTESTQHAVTPLSRPSLIMFRTLVSLILPTPHKVVLVLTRILEAPGISMMPPHGKAHTAQQLKMELILYQLAIKWIKSQMPISFTATVHQEISGLPLPVPKHLSSNLASSWLPDNSKPSTTTLNSVSKLSRVAQVEQWTWSFSHLLWSLLSVSSSSDEVDDQINYKRWTLNKEEAKDNLKEKYRAVSYFTLFIISNIKHWSSMSLKQNDSTLKFFKHFYFLIYIVT